MQTVWPPTQDSIFGDTYGGVPNPMVPHRHPWPTRFHGPNYTVPGVAKPTYQERPYAKTPYMGTAFGAECAPIFSPITGNRWLDAALAGGVGFLVAPKAAERPVWIIMGALAGYAAGFAGLAGTAGAGYLMQK